MAPLLVLLLQLAIAIFSIVGLFSIIWGFFRGFQRHAKTTALVFLLFGVGLVTTAFSLDLIS
jgi:hypothetical protein